MSEFGNLYILRDRRPVEPATVEECRSFFESMENRVVCQECFGEDCEIGTIFLGTDHGPDSNGNLLLFETAIRRPNGWDALERCATWEEAERQHVRTVLVTLPCIAGLLYFIEDGKLWVIDPGDLHDLQLPRTPCKRHARLITDKTEELDVRAQLCHLTM